MSACCQDYPRCGCNGSIRIGLIGPNPPELESMSIDMSAAKYAAALNLPKEQVTQELEQIINWSQFINDRKITHEAKCISYRNKGSEFEEKIWIDQKKVRDGGNNLKHGPAKRKKKAKKFGKNKR